MSWGGAHAVALHGRSESFACLLAASRHGKQRQICGTAQAKDAWHSGAVVWGEPGTNSQHLLPIVAQGTVHPVDFVAFKRLSGHDHMHELLLSNAIAQSEALLTGKTPAADSPIGCLREPAVDVHVVRCVDAQSLASSSRARASFCPGRPLGHCEL